MPCFSFCCYDGVSFLKGMYWWSLRRFACFSRVLHVSHSTGLSPFTCPEQATRFCYTSCARWMQAFRAGSASHIAGQALFRLYDAFVIHFFICYCRFVVIFSGSSCFDVFLFVVGLGSGLAFSQKKNRRRSIVQMSSRSCLHPILLAFNIFFCFYETIFPKASLLNVDEQ